MLSDVNPLAPRSVGVRVSVPINRESAHEPRERRRGNRGRSSAGASQAGPFPGSSERDPVGDLGPGDDRCAEHRQCARRQFIRGCGRRHPGNRGCWRATTAENAETSTSIYPSNLYRYLGNDDMARPCPHLSRRRILGRRLLSNVYHNDTRERGRICSTLVEARQRAAGEGRRRCDHCSKGRLGCLHPIEPGLTRIATKAARAKRAPSLRGLELPKRRMWRKSRALESRREEACNPNGDVAA